MSALRLKDYVVRSSHIREDWGKKIMHPSEFVSLDYKSIKESDILLAYIDDCSTGLYIELGWASSLGKNRITRETSNIFLTTRQNIAVNNLMLI